MSSIYEQLHLYRRCRRLLFFSPSPSLTTNNNHEGRPLYLDKSLWLAFASAVFAVFVYVFLNVLLSCLRRRFIDGPTTAAANNDKTSADAAAASVQLNAFTIFLFKQLKMTSDSSSNLDVETECCSVCLAEYEDDDEVRVMPRCRHVFHKDCVDRWLITRSSFCPNCRNRVIKRALEPPAGACRNPAGPGGGVVGGMASVVLSRPA